MKPGRILILIFLSCMICCCTDFRVYHSKYHIPDEGWNKIDTLSIRLLVSDTLKSYRLSAIVRNNHLFSYQDLPVSITHNFPDTLIWHTDTLQFNIADKEGKWLGTGWNGFFQNSIPFRESMVDHPAEYTFKFKHLLDTENISGIFDVSVLAESF